MGKCTWEMRNGKRCGKPGEGNPCLCDRHYEQMMREAEEDEDEVEDGGGGFFDSVVVEEIVDEVIEHPRVQGVFNKAGSLLDRFANLVDAAASGRRSPPPPPPPGPESVGSDGGREQRRQQRQQQREQRRPPPPPPNPNAEAQQAMREAFMLFGWDPKKSYTEQDVKKRKQELSRVYHPDLNPSGSAEMMKRINASADLLVQALKR